MQVIKNTDEPHWDEEKFLKVQEIEQVSKGLVASSDFSISKYAGRTCRSTLHSVLTSALCPVCSIQ